uniref:Uncharacterized protein n=1 Tax=Chenopodium quinoa TaxID=63459 RepID=A0A803M559_CHEQI
MSSSDEPQAVEKHMPIEPTPIWKLIAVASIAAGVKFGWALQLSLLTPYVQLLGVTHTMSSLIWLCGPVSGIIVQPTVGYTSDRCTSKFGRRKPFITIGTTLICLAVLLIGFAADVGHSFGDNLQKKTKPRAVVLFVIGFWILDIANNMVQVFAAEFKTGAERKEAAESILTAYKAAQAPGASVVDYRSYYRIPLGHLQLGNVLGYAAGSASGLYKFLPFTKTTACDTYCANLKTCFLIEIVLLVAVVVLALVAVKEPPVERVIDDETPFFIQGNAGEKRLYDMGVRTGALGLMLTALSLGCMSLCVDPLSKLLGGAKYTWGLVNFILAASLAGTLPLTKMVEKARRHKPLHATPSPSIKSGTLALFAATGIPQAATYSIPFALASMYSSDNGAGHVSAVISGVLALTIIPATASNA